MPDDKERRPMPTAPSDTRPERNSDRGTIEGPYTDRRGYQTPQDQGDHWNPPDRDNRE